MFNGSTSYVFSVYKLLANGEKAIIFDKQVDESIYNSLLEFKDERYDKIVKRRYYFAHNGEYFYLDVFANNNEIGILEINVLENEVVMIPEFISAIDNVTRDESYYNKMIALKERKELKKK